MSATQPISEPATAPLDDPYDFYTTQDLIDRKIVSDRADLRDKIKHDGFDPGIKMGPAAQSRRIFRKVRVHAYLDRKASEQPVTA